MAWQDGGHHGGSDWDGGTGLSHTPGEQMQKIWRLLNWSFSVGSVFGIRIRIHVTFIVLVVYQLVVSAVGAGWVDAGTEALWTLLWLTLLFVSVLLHEFGHCFACRREGGEADEVLIWPLGGLAMCDPPPTPRAHFITAAGGPAVNVVLAIASWVGLQLWYGSPVPVSWNPLSPWIGAAPDVLGRSLVYLYVVNYFLLLFNLLLVFYPFDGGRLIHAGLWARFGYGRGTLISCWIGIGGAIVAAVIGLIIGELLVVFLAAYGGHMCYQQLVRLRHEPPPDERFQAAWWREEAPRRKVSRLSRWRQARVAARLGRLRAQAAKRDADLDRILEKVARQGLQSLSAGEKRALRQETARRRNGE